MHSDEHKELKKMITGAYSKAGGTGCGGSFSEVLAYELSTQPVNPRMKIGATGLSFREIADKWGIPLSTLGELLLDQCVGMGDYRCKCETPD